MKKLLFLGLLAASCGPCDLEEEKIMTAPKTELNIDTTRPQQPQTETKAPAKASPSLEIVWKEAPKTGINDFTVKFSNFEDYRLINVKQFMPSMGHGAPKLDLKWTVDPSDESTWEVSGLLFSMSGSWQLEFVIESDSNKLSLSKDVLVD